MKKVFIILLSACLLAACSSDVDENNVIAIDVGVNALLIQSDNGKTSVGTMYKSGEGYNPPHCYITKVIHHNHGNPFTTYGLAFVANIKGSDICDFLDIYFESNQPMSFSELKPGDTFDSSQFNAVVDFVLANGDKSKDGATASSGSVTVVDTKTVDDKTFLVLRLTNLRFDAKNHSCVYTMNGTIEYEIWDMVFVD